MSKAKEEEEGTSLGAASFRFALSDAIPGKNILPLCGLRRRARKDPLQR